MSVPATAVYNGGIATTPDGAVYVQHTDGATQANPTFTGTGGSGYPIILAQSWAAVSGAADTNENTLATITVPANAMGANGRLRIQTQWTFTNNANNKTVRIRFSGAAGTQYLVNTSASVAGILQATTTIANRGATNSQIGASTLVAATTFGVNGTASTTSAVDTTAATTLVITAQKATGTDTMTLDGYTVELIKP